MDGDRYVWMCGLNAVDKKNKNTNIIYLPINNIIKIKI